MLFLFSIPIGCICCWIFFTIHFYFWEHFVFIQLHKFVRWWFVLSLSLFYLHVSIRDFSANALRLLSTQSSLDLVSVEFKSSFIRLSLSFWLRIMLYHFPVESKISLGIFFLVVLQYNLVNERLNYEIEFSIENKLLHFFGIHVVVLLTPIILPESLHFFAFHTEQELFQETVWMNWNKKKNNLFMCYTECGTRNTAIRYCWNTNVIRLSKWPTRCCCWPRIAAGRSPALASDDGGSLQAADYSHSCRCGGARAGQPLHRFRHHRTRDGAEGFVTRPAIEPAAADHCWGAGLDVLELWRVSKRWSCS